MLAVVDAGSDTPPSWEVAPESSATGAEQDTLADVRAACAGSRHLRKTIKYLSACRALQVCAEAPAALSRSRLHDPLLASPNMAQAIVEAFCEAHLLSKVSFAGARSSIRRSAGHLRGGPPSESNVCQARIAWYKSLLAPADLIRPYAEQYWNMGLNDQQIVDQLQDHFDPETYTLGLKSFKRLRKTWGLTSTRQQKHNHETIGPAVHEIRTKFPTMGARQMVGVLRQNYKIKASETLVAGYLKLVEPDAVQMRKAKKFKRRRFWAAGVNDILAMDQHDKWKRLWSIFTCCGGAVCRADCMLKIWWTNRNPRLITSFYLEAARKAGGVPLVTQSDPGSENFGGEQYQTEIAGGLLRRHFTPGFEALLDEGHLRGYTIQTRSLKERWNSTSRRADKHKVTPHGIPDLITAKPERFGTRDFKVPFCCGTRAYRAIGRDGASVGSADHPVFELVPRDFEVLIKQLYTQVGEPVISRETFWEIYIELLTCLRSMPMDDLDFNDTPHSHAYDHGHDDPIPLLQGLRDLRHGDEAAGPRNWCYMGGVDEPQLPDAVQKDVDAESGDDGEDHEEDERVRVMFSWSRGESGGGERIVADLSGAED
ncbi:hypothetical protein B0H21DRAFT_712436 [Amylocystis lapponica]|nr:hypothetical protein B0H21DRAFT_712436 [Amylocystis lapponica]